MAESYPNHVPSWQTDLQQALAAIDAKIVQLQSDKEGAVKACDFERASIRRYQIDRWLIMKAVLGRLKAVPANGDNHSVLDLVECLFLETDAEAAAESNAHDEERTMVLKIDLTGK